MGIPKVLRSNYGQVVVNFGEPIRLNEVLAEHASAAREELAQLPDCPAGKALASLTTYVVARTA